MRRGTILATIASDRETMMRRGVRYNYPLGKFHEALFVSKSDLGTLRFKFGPPDSLPDLLRNQGSVDVKVREAGRDHGEDYKVEIAARLPSEPPIEIAS